MSGEDLATLGIKVDASEVDAAVPKLDRLVAAGSNAEKQTASLGNAAERLRAQLQAAGASAADIDKAISKLGLTAKDTAAAYTATGAAAQAAAAQTGAAAAAAIAKNEAMAVSLGALGGASVRAAAQQIAASEATAAATAEGAAVQIAANTNVAASSVSTSLVVRESLVLMREASVGNFTRMAGSATILISALGLMYAVLLPVVGVAIALGAGFELARNQINSGVEGTGDLTRSLGLTAEQLARVKDRYVEFGDTVKATFQVIWRDIGGDGGALSRAIQSVWNGIAEFIDGTMKFIAGTVLGGIRVIEEGWKAMPKFLGGEGSTAGIDFAKAFQSGLDDAKKGLDGFYSDVAKQARDNALTRIKKQAGKAPQDGAENSAEKLLQQINDQTAAYSKYNDELARGSVTLGTVLEQQKEDRALKSIIARIELDHKMTLEHKLALINSLRVAQHGLNIEEAEFAVQQQTAHNSQTLALLEKEVETLGLSNVERATELALLRAKQELENRGVDPNSKAGQAFTSSVVNVAAGQAAAKEAADAFNSSLQLQSNLMQEVADHANAMASTLGDSFGHVGTAIADLTGSLTHYSTQQAKFAEEQLALDKLRKDNNPDIAKEIELTKKKADVDTEYYADVLGAAKNFFAQGSAGYKFLQAAETAYRVYQLASSIAGIIVKETETAAVVTANATQTASAATTAVANAAADVPFPFNLGAVATVVALLAGFGILAGGGGGGSAAPVVDIAKATQAAQGAGSVLGDASAKSDSIARSLDALAKDTNSDLEYSNQMVVSLKAIQAGIGSLTGLLARQLQVGGLFDTSKLGLGSSSSGGSGLIGGLISSIFCYSSSSTTLLDQGIQIAGTTIGAAVANGVAANAYQSTKTDSHSSALFGLISSSSSSTKTTNTALSSDFTDQISSIVGGLRSTVLDAAKKLGIDGAQQVVDSLSLNIGNISFKDMTGSQIQDALNAVFSKVGDQLAEAAVPVVTQLQKVGEGALETLARLANEYAAVDDAAKTVGFTFTQVGVDSLFARDRLIQASGGLDQFTSQAQFFVSNFETSSRALAPIAKSVADEMARLNATGIKTKDQFAQLVQAIDTSSKGGAELYAALMMVAPAFAKVADAAQALADKRTDMEIKVLQDEGDAIGALALQRQKELSALDDSLKPLQLLTYAVEDMNAANDNLTKAQTDLTNAQKALADAQRSANQVTQQSIDKFKQFVTSLTAFQQSLVVGPLANNSIARQYGVTKSIFNSTAAAAAGGDPVALSNLQQASTDFLTASKSASSTSVQYARDLAAVRAGVAAGTAAAQHQVDINTQQLYAVQDVGSNVLTVGDAIDNLTKIQSAFNTAQLAFNAAQLTAMQAKQTATQAAVDQDRNAAVASVTEAISNFVNNNPPANDNSATQAIIQAAISKIDTTNSDAVQASYNAALKQLDNILNTASALLDSAGVFHSTAIATDVPSGQMGLWNVGTNLWNDPALSGVLSQFENLQNQFMSTFTNAQNLFSQIPGHANGLGYVPRDNYIARLHEGERVLTKKENQSYAANNDVLNELRTMNARLVSVEKHSKDSAAVLKRVGREDSLKVS